MEIKIGEIYIVQSNNLLKSYTIDKITEITENYFVSDYVNTYNTYHDNNINHIKDYVIITTLNEYLENPQKYPKYNYDKIMKMYQKFMENDIVEARKYKLKLLENYGN